MEKQKFRTIIEGRGPKGAWPHIVVPPDVPQAWGVKGVCAVTGTINGHPVRTSLMPRDGGFYIMANKEIRAATGAGVGDEVDVVLERDLEPRTVDTPPDLANALASDPKAAEIYETLSYSHKKEYVDWINSAKQEATREKRIEQAIAMTLEKKRLS